VPPPYGPGRSVEWRRLFKLCLSDVWPCPPIVRVGSPPVDLVRALSHRRGALVPPAHGLGRTIEWRGLFKLLLSGVWPGPLIVPAGSPPVDLVRTRAHGPRTVVPPPGLSASHANRPESKEKHRAQTENEMFHRCVTSKAGCVASLLYGTVTSCSGRVSTKPGGPETCSPYHSRLYGEQDAFQIRRKPAFLLRPTPNGPTGNSWNR